MFSSRVGTCLSLQLNQVSREFVKPQSQRESAKASRLLGKYSSHVDTNPFLDSHWFLMLVTWYYCASE